MSLSHKISRDDETGVHTRRQKVDQMRAGMHEERAESSRRGFVREEVAELNGSSRRWLGMPPSGLIEQHRGCVGTCSCTGDTHSGHNRTHRVDAHGMKRIYDEATSAPACTNAMASLVTWQGDTCQARHTTHYHHHYYYEWHNGPIRSRHANPARICCCAINTPHDFSSLGDPPINYYPVNICAAGPAKPTPAPTSQSKRFTKPEQAEKDLYAAEGALSLLGHSAEAASVPAAEEAALSVHAAGEAPPLTVFKARPPPPFNHCTRQLPPFPSSHASPYVLCQHCSRLLLLPPGTLLFPSSGTLLLQSFLFVKLKCGYCLNISKFSTRHLHRASSSSLAEGPCTPVSTPGLPSMPSCITSNGVMQEASSLNHNETEEPLYEIFEPSLETNSLKSKSLINGNAKHTLKHESLEKGELLSVEYKHPSNQNHIDTSDPLNGQRGDSVQSTEETGAMGNGKCVRTQENVNRTSKSLNGACEDLSQSKHVQTGVLLNGECARIQEMVIETMKPLNVVYGDLTQTEHLETSALLNGKCAHTQENVIETVEPLNGICRDLAEPKHLETGMLVSGYCGQTAKDKDNKASLNGVCVDTSDQKEIIIGVQDRQQEITAFSSVLDWVDSLSVEIGYDSDNQLQGPMNCPNDCDDGVVKFGSSRRRSRLHQHFGYSSPSELFEKVLFSEDEEIKIRTQTNSTASSSFSSINACQPTEIRSPPIQVHAPSLRSWSINPDGSGVRDSIDQQSSLAGLLRRTLKRGSLLPARPRTRVVVNGHTLSSAAIKQAEERAGKLRPGSYWYDCKAGFWGVEGGPCLGILPPYIEELNYPMTRHCSNGDTKVYVNGRELHVKDLAVLSQRGLSQKAGTAYVLGFDGVLVDETTGLELKQLGKLAPTVERKGKGFGMFTADVLQSKTPAVHQIKLANSNC